MLANPVIVSPYADPLVWLIAFVAIWAEARVACWLLRRLGQRHRGILGVLVVVNLCSWPAFLGALFLADRQGVLAGPVASTAVIAALEAVVILFEAALIHEMTRGRLFSRDFGCTPIAFGRALGVSLVANLVSIAVSLLVPLAIFLVVALLR